MYVYIDAIHTVPFWSTLPLAPHNVSLPTVVPSHCGPLPLWSPPTVVPSHCGPHPGVPLVAYEVVEHQGQLALNELQRGQLGLQLPARFGSVEVDTASFLLRQQETAAAAAESNISPEQQGEGGRAGTAPAHTRGLPGGAKFCNLKNPNPSPKTHTNTNPRSPYFVMRFIVGYAVYVHVYVP